MKTIVLKQKGKKVYQFRVSDIQLELAKKLGISEREYITERAKIELAEKDNKNED
jgi:hypothetical protein